MNKSLKYSLICIGVILALLSSSLAYSPTAWAQEGGQTGARADPQYGSSSSTTQQSKSDVYGAAPRNGQVITRVLARGGPIHGANGLYFGPDGYLYIASCFGANITVMDPNSGRIVRKIILKEGMNAPDDLTFGPDGSLYWTAITTGVIGKMTPDGTQSIVAQLPIGVNPITFTDDGKRLFTALDFLGDGFYEIYLDGVTPPRLIIPTLGWLNGFDFGPDGLLYGPLLQPGKVVKINVDTGEMWDVVTDVLGTAAVKFGPDGMMYFINQPTGEVKRMDLDSGEIELITILPNSLDNLAFDAQGRLFVSSAEDGFIVEVMQNGEVRPVSPGGMIAPGGVAILPDANGRDNVFVGDLWVLRQFNGQTGRELFVERGNMAEVFTIAPDGMNLIASSFISNAVYLYDPSSRSLIDTRNDFYGPINAIRFQGDLIVSEIGTSSVVRSSGLGDRQVLVTLALPLGLAATDDDLWVADWALGMVFQLVQDGIPVMIPLADGLDEPEGLAVMPDGNLLVVEAGAGRVSIINSETGVVTPFVEGLRLGGMHLSGLPPFLFFNGIAVSQQTGAIYVSGDEANLLYRIDKRP
jgi:DNA-binding beta-propeller fold protein YncE